MPALRDLIERIRAYCLELGEVPVEVKIILQSGRKVCHPVPAVPASAPAPARTVDAVPRKGGAPARHSIDFRSVHWYGRDYTFTAGQASCVRVLWEAWENGTPEVSQAAVLEAAGCASDSLRTLFQGSPAWGTLIVQGQKGAYRLHAPGDAPEAEGEAG